MQDPNKGTISSS